MKGSPQTGVGRSEPGQRVKRGMADGAGVRVPTRFVQKYTVRTRPEPPVLSHVVGLDRVQPGADPAAAWIKEVAPAAPAPGRLVAEERLRPRQGPTHEAPPALAMAHRTGGHVPGLARHGPPLAGRNGRGGTGARRSPRPPTRCCRPSTPTSGGPPRASKTGRWSPPAPGPARLGRWWRGRATPSAASARRPGAVAFITFTNKATEEIRQRTRERLPGLQVGTIHQLARRVLKLVDGRTVQLSRMAEDEGLRLRRIAGWIREVDRDPGLAADVALRRGEGRRTG